MRHCSQPAKDENEKAEERAVTKTWRNKSRAPFTLPWAKCTLTRLSRVWGCTSQHKTHTLMTEHPVPVIHPDTSLVFHFCYLRRYIKKKKRFFFASLSNGLQGICRTFIFLKVGKKYGILGPTVWDSLVQHSFIHSDIKSCF